MQPIEEPSAQANEAEHGNALMLERKTNVKLKNIIFFMIIKFKVKQKLNNSPTNLKIKNEKSCYSYDF